MRNTPKTLIESIMQKPPKSGFTIKAEFKNNYLPFQAPKNVPLPPEGHYLKALFLPQLKIRRKVLKKNLQLLAKKEKVNQRIINHKKEVLENSPIQKAFSIIKSSPSCPEKKLLNYLKSSQSIV